MESRIDIGPLEPDAHKAILGLDEYLGGVGLSPTLNEISKIRASQINGCAYCIQMHTEQARKQRETEQRIYALSAMNALSAKKDILKSIVLGLLASISIYISVYLGIPAWVLFIGWASHDLFCPKAKNLLSVLLQEIIGMLLAFSINIIGYFLQTYIEIWGILISVFLIIALLYWVTKLKYFNNIIAYFLGMTAWFSFQSYDIHNSLPILILSLSIGFCFGYLFSWLSNKIEAKY